MCNVLVSLMYFNWRTDKRAEKNTDSANQKKNVENWILVDRNEKHSTYVIQDSAYIYINIYLIEIGILLHICF